MIGVRVRGNLNLTQTALPVAVVSATPVSELQNALSSPLHLHSTHNTYFLLLDSVDLFYHFTHGTVWW